MCNFLSMHEFPVISVCKTEISGSGACSRNCFALLSLLQSHVWSQSNLLQFCKQKSNQHLSVRMCVHHNFSCGGLLVSCDQRLSAVCLPPCRDWSCWALYSLLRQDVNKLTEAFGQARRRNCSQAFYGGSRKFNTQMLSIYWEWRGEQELKMESAKICTLHLGSMQ